MALQEIDREYGGGGQEQFVEKLREGFAAAAAREGASALMLLTGQDWLNAAIKAAEGGER